MNGQKNKHSDTFSSITLEKKISYQLSSNMSSEGSAQSPPSSFTSTVSTTPQASLKLGVKPGRSANSPKTEFSHSLSSSVSASLITSSHAKLYSPPISTSSALKSSSLSTSHEQLCNATSGARVAGHEKKLKLKKGCISGIHLDFHYRNLLTASGRGRSTLGTGSGAPAGCDLM